MAFTQEFIDSLLITQEKKSAQYFNSLPVSRAKSSTGNTELDAQAKLIKELAANKKMATILQREKFNARAYADIFQFIYEYSVKDIDLMIQQLENLHSDTVKKIIVELKVFRDLYAQDIKAKYQPKGLYGCLNSVTELCSSSLTMPISIPFQQALLKGVVMPVMSLFDDLEENGDLTAESIPKLMLAKTKMLEALTQFKATQNAALQEELKKFDKELKDNVEKSLAPKKEKLIGLEESLEKLIKLYHSEKENLSPPQVMENEKAIADIRKEIDKLKEDIDAWKAKYDKHLQKKKDELVKTRESEEQKLDIFFDGVTKEFDYIIKSIKVLDQKGKIDKKYPPSSTKSELKKRKKEIEKLQNESEKQLQFLLSDESSIKAKKYIKKHGGKLLYSQNQARLAAMAHSEGLCGGYSAEFLEICSAPGWNDLTFEQKMKRFKPILSAKDTFKLTASANPMVNTLWMTLESGLRWDIQTSPAYKQNAVIFEIKTEDKPDKPKAFFQKYVDNIMAKTSSSESAKLMLWIFAKKSGHALGLNYDKDGFLFHDSNVGYIRFEDASKFSAFMVDHLYKNYPDLTDNATIFDFNVMHKNAINMDFDFKLKREQSRLASIPEMVSLHLKRKETKLLEGLESVRTLINSASQKLEKATSRAIETPQSPPLQDQQSVVLNERGEEPATAFTHKRKKTVTFSTDVLPQVRAIKDLENQDRMKSLVEKYMTDYDTLLNEKPVFKQKIFLEVRELMQNNPPNMDNLKKLCLQHKLPKCEKMLEQIDALYVGRQKGARTAPK